MRLRESASRHSSTSISQSLAKSSVLKPRETNGCPVASVSLQSVSAQSTSSSSSQVPAAASASATLANTTRTTRPVASEDPLNAARLHHVTTAENARSVRAQHDLTHEALTNARAIDLILDELTVAFEARPTPQALPKVTEMPFQVDTKVAPAQPSDRPALGDVPFHPLPSAEERAVQAAALIERIEVFVKSQRPALALTLNNSLGARIELERLGAGRIALRLVGNGGPPSPEIVSRIREELRARGLQLGALSID